jgi:hypothetical protein
VRKGSAFPKDVRLEQPSSAQAARLSLPACAEGDEGYIVSRKAEGFPQIAAAEPRQAWRELRI